jgi:hypothetical protein
MVVVRVKLLDATMPLLTQFELAPLLNPTSGLPKPLLLSIHIS